jgi:hypothetical protein
MIKIDRFILSKKKNIDRFTYYLRQEKIITRIFSVIMRDRRSVED